MTSEEAIKILQGAIKKPNTKDGYLGQAIDMAIKALEQEPCEDCVSRQAVIDMTGLSNWFESSDDYNSFVREFCKLPSVTPTRKKGKWCKQNDDYFDWYECSECGYGSDGEMQYSSEYDVRTKYCPNCGTEMESEV